MPLPPATQDSDFLYVHANTLPAFPAGDACAAAALVLYANVRPDFGRVGLVGRLRAESDCSDASFALYANVS